MKRRIISLSIVIALLLSFPIIATADGELYRTDFSDPNTFDDWIISHDGIEHEIEFFDGGVRMINLATNVNFQTYVIPWDLTGMEFGKDYIVSFAGRALVENPENYTVIAQLRSRASGNEWNNLLTIDGVSAEDGAGYPIKENGMFQYSVKIEGSLTDMDIHRDAGFYALCVWGTYQNNPTSYELYYIYIDEADDFVPYPALPDPTDNAWEVLGPPEATPEPPVLPTPMPIVTPTPAPEPTTPAPTPETSAPVVDDNGGGALIWILIGAGAVAVIAVVIILVTKKKK